MKSERQNEMDILLRRMAKQDSSVSEKGNGSQEAAAHLDVDELNVFAERALPPAAQARYTAHLADCSTCRRLVAQLSAAAGPLVAEPKAEPAKTSFWQRLPAFLSPAVLRFAAPALALLAVITVGIITFRQQQSPELVAQNQEQPAAETARIAPAASTTSDVPETTRSASPAPVASTVAPVTKAPETGSTTGAVDKVTNADSTAAVAVTEDKTKPSKAGEEAQPTFAPEPPPATPARPAPGTVANKNEAVAKEKSAPVREKDDTATVAAAPQARDERAAQEREARSSVSRKAAAAGRGGALSSVESRRVETEQGKRSDQDEVTREVAGRRFRREQNSWVDTGYDSSRPLINVVRGSEQYRALVADEPSIRTIAERLAGEVIVVWRGRAYRIR